MKVSKKFKRALESEVRRLLRATESPVGNLLVELEGHIKKGHWVMTGSLLSKIADLVRSADSSTVQAYNKMYSACKSGDEDAALKTLNAFRTKVRMTRYVGSQARKAKRFA